MDMLIMSDFSGRGLRAEISELVSQSLIPVDVDNFEDVLLRLAPQIELPQDDPAKPTMRLQFEELDDFHPDSLFRKLEIFQEHRRLREQLLNPSTFSEAVAGLKGRAESRTEVLRPDDDMPDPGRGDESETQEELLGRLLGARSSADHPGKGERPSAQSTHDTVDEFIERTVAPHVVPDVELEQTHLVAALDGAIGLEMRNTLHHPSFQALEASWRGLHKLVTTVQTEENVQVYLFDASKEELVADVDRSGGDLERMKLYRVLAEHDMGTPGGESWSLFVGNYRFETSADDLKVLASLGTIGSLAGVPFLAEARPLLIGCESAQEAGEPTGWRPLDPEHEGRWRALRHSPVARWIGLLLPRFLIRSPYGEKSDPIDAFTFEELFGGTDHEAYLWCNPAFACAMVAAAAGEKRGGSITQGGISELGDLPGHIYVEGGETKKKACAEMYLSDRSAETILARGIMPLLSHKHRNAIRIARLQSIAAPPTALAGLDS